jgi:hypothetical protein
MQKQRRKRVLAELFRKSEREALPRLEFAICRAWLGMIKNPTPEAKRALAPPDGSRTTVPNCAVPIRHCGWEWS